jgi:hypothetical protein
MNAYEQGYSAYFQDIRIGNQSFVSDGEYMRGYKDACKAHRAMPQSERRGKGLVYPGVQKVMDIAARACGLT